MERQGSSRLVLTEAIKAAAMVTRGKRRREVSGNNSWTRSKGIG
jgi:hypothetical protein